MNKIAVCIRDRDLVRQIFYVGYTSEGGFFIKDLVRICDPNKEAYYIAKYLTNVKNHGSRTITPEAKYTTKGDAKLMHHLDGKVQISGNLVVSGFDIDGVPKGSAVPESMPLPSTNDGGPIITFSIAKIRKLRDCKKGDFILDISPTRPHPAHENKALNGWGISIFWVPKGLLEGRDLSLPVPYFSALSGNISLQMVPSPENCPGMLGLLLERMPVEFEGDFSFALSGGPGKVIDGTYCESLILTYPAPHALEDARDLNFTPKDD